MFQQNISFLSSRRTIQFWLLLTQNFIKVHGNNTALTWNAGLCIFKFLFCMDFAKFMCFVHKLRPSSCLILNQQVFTSRPLLLFSIAKVQHRIRLIFKMKAPYILISSSKKSPCHIFPPSKQNAVEVFYLLRLMFCRLSNRFECTCETLLKLSGNVMKRVRG